MSDNDVFCFAGNVFNCDCSLLWMNRLAAETINELVRRAFSDAQCLMNDTADDRVGGGGGEDDDNNNGYSTDSRTGDKAHANGGSGVPAIAAGFVGGTYSRKSDAKSAADVGGPSSAGATSSEGFGAGVSDVMFKAYDESQLTKVSALTEDTCPGKEQPLEDGAPDAAQNSDRVLWESNNKSGAGRAAADRSLLRSSATLPILLSALVFTVRHRLC